MRSVLINREKLLGYVDNFKKHHDVPFPELEGHFGCPKGEVPVLKIKAASLDDQIRANTMAEKAVIMATKLLQNFANKKFQDVVNMNEIARELNNPLPHEKTHLEISLFHKCVIQPQFSLREAVMISEALPEVVNRVASMALQLSSMESVNGDYQRS